MGNKCKTCFGNKIIIGDMSMSWIICIVLTILIFVVGIAFMALISVISEDKLNAILLGLVSVAVFLWTVIEIHKCIFGHSLF